MVHHCSIFAYKCNQSRFFFAPYKISEREKVQIKGGGNPSKPSVRDLHDLYDIDYFPKLFKD